MTSQQYRAAIEPNGRLNMSILEQLRKALQEYKGPITGNSIEAVWFREAARQLLALESSK